MKPILETRALTHVYGEGTPFRHVALEDVNLKIYPGELIGLIGHTGSGKSTLIQHFNGLLKPTSGEILLNGEDIHRTKSSTVAARFSV
ncbi:MAG: ATP-binding cassette domain-containing protein, partial [Clostridia bacterium]|nr:ATP-binding cassette domain-containing protein [Clostridia bacterium]